MVSEVFAIISHDLLQGADSSERYDRIGQTLHVRM